jgi:hypothetical protein
MRVNGKHSRVSLGMLALLLGAVPLAGAATVAPPCPEGGIPPWVPRYDLDIQLDVEHHTAHVYQRVTWTNRHPQPTAELVFNAHSHYKIPDKEVGFLAKMLEIMRMPPGDALDLEGHACEVQKVKLLSPGPDSQPPNGQLDFHFDDKNPTALVVPLPLPVGQGESVQIEIEFTMRLPQKQGRWGQWQGVTYLSNWNPVLAFYDEHGWQPTPFVPWHQPFFNEAGIYSVRATLPADQKIACSAPVQEVTDLGAGMVRVDFHSCCLRDFALLCSARYCEYTGQVGPVQVRCLAFPEHEFYAREMVKIACEALPVYSRWFGPFPYGQFTIAESYFGWNGNECGALVMIDERVFGMPHLARNYVDYLVSHETCHQWWYNVVGTNGYAETWMDEALATYFSHRLMDIKHGRNNRILEFPQGLEWLPNIERETYRYYGLYGTLGRGEQTVTVQNMEKFGHVINLFSMCYDRGSKIVGMIEYRLGEVAFFDFMRIVYKRYQFRIIRVADFERELEAYTGEDWSEFFQHWLYGAGMSDWCIEKVSMVRSPYSAVPGLGLPEPGCEMCAKGRREPYKVTVLLHQKAEYNEQTVLGFSLDGSDKYQVRVPILPQAGVVEIDDPPARIETLPHNRVRVEVVLPCKPTQIAVDPDQVLLDREPANNYWKQRIRWRWTPLYTQLEETDLTTAYDRWNVIIGPWVYDPAYYDPWFSRSMMAGVRADIYRTQQFNGGVYMAYRTDYRDIAVGVDALWDHWPWAPIELGLTAEGSLTPGMGDRPSDRAVLFGRYVIQYGDSLYLPPMHYAEVFGAIQNHALPIPKQVVPGEVPFDNTTSVGVHYHLDYLTPYWDPEGGFRFDATYASGIPVFGEREAYNRVDAQFSFVKGVPDGLGWLSETRVAARAYGGIASPNKGEFFTLGGSELVRGFDLAQRQGSRVWVGSVEWRFPLAQRLSWDTCDHCLGLRNIYGAAFYDVGDVYANGQSVGGVAHAVGGGLRLDVTLFSFVERATLRFDVAKTINANTPFQFWFGLQYPF